MIEGKIGHAFKSHSNISLSGISTDIAETGSSTQMFSA
jgi:hypothetical protein